MAEVGPMLAGRLTKVIHKTPYPAVSPTRPEVSQAGKTVLVTGGSGVIGSHIASAFAEAGASTFILVGRREAVVASAAAALVDKFSDKKVRAFGLSCDVTRPDDVNLLWKKLAQDGVLVDVLVLTAGKWTGGPLLDIGTDAVWEDMTVNSYGNMNFTEKFYKQPGRDPKTQLTLLNVATSEIYDFGPYNKWPLYSLSKNSGALLLQLIARDVLPEDMQVVSFHPGLIFSDFVRDIGLKENEQDWDSPVLAGNFAVWAASPEAKFLHGRFAWAGWDLDELRSGSIRERIYKDPKFLTIGVHGL